VELVLYPDPILRRRAARLPAVDQAVRERAREMFSIMYAEGGVGLAAPQVGWSVRLFVINLTAEPDPAKERVYINPEIVRADGEVTEEEGCLSIPGVRGKVARKERVLVRASDLEGAPFEEEAIDLHARVVQHELDHLDGILFVQRLGAAEKTLVRKALKKLEEDYKKGKKPA
jgi:peptide deformylase